MSQVRLGRDIEGISDVSEIQGEVVPVNQDETLKSMTAIGISVEPTDDLRQSAYAGMPNFKVFATTDLIPINVRRTSVQSNTKLRMSAASSVLSLPKNRLNAPNDRFKLPDLSHLDDISIVSIDDK